MFVVAVEFEILSDKVEQFRQRVLVQASTSLASEPGCHQFDVCFDDERPTTCFLYEKYGTPEDFAEHRKTPHFAQFNDAVSPMTASKVVKTYTCV